MNKLRWFVVPIATALLVLAVACGGDSDDEDDMSNGATGGGGTGVASTGAGTQAEAPSPTEASSVPDAPTPADSPTPADGPTEAASDGTLDMASLSASLDAIESFRFDLTMAIDFDLPESGQSEDAAAAAMLMALFSNISAEGTYVAPDSYEMTMSFIGLEMQAIQIGQESWINDGSGWVADSGMGMSPFGSASPAELPFEFIPEAVLAGAETSSETVNGIETTRFSFDKDSLAALAEATGETAGIEDLSEVDTMDLDVWLTADGIPVKMIMDMQGESEGSQIAINLEFNVRDINDPSIQIEPPL